MQAASRGLLFYCPGDNGRRKLRNNILIHGMTYPIRGTGGGRSLQSKHFVFILDRKEIPGASGA